MQSTIVRAAAGLLIMATLGAAPAFAQGGGAGGGGGGGGPPRGFSLPPLLMQTDAFPDGGIVPPKYAGPMGVQPGFTFTGAPDTTQTYAIIFHDIDVSIGNNTGDVLHWMAWNIPASAKGIPEGKLPEGSVNGNNLRGQPGYMGPGAPAGVRYHHYVFELYALNTKLDLPATATRDQLLAAMQGKIVAKAAYVGRFHQEPPKQ
jgi:Raf kinase inhibitor-like YbhB/YbcL family protein